jgi:hypothetical protein
MMTLDTNMVLTGVLSFRGGIPHSMQAFAHSYLPFLDLFVHIIVLGKEAFASFTFTYIKPFKTLLSLVAY